MATKVILDGSLFSECEQYDSNRSGMHRVAEDITKFLINDPYLDISFANTNYSNFFNDLLTKFIERNYPSHREKIVSRKPFFTSEIPKLRGLLNRMSKKLALETTIPEIEKSDLFHSFYYPFPRNIARKNIKKSITFLDIISLRIDGYSQNLIRLTKEIVESIIPNFAISISEFSKQDLLDYDKEIDPGQIFVAPLAASENLFFPNKDRSSWKTVREKYKLPDNYFLSLSSIDKRKNLPHLIQSFSNFVSQEKPADLFLVLTGNSSYSRSILEELNINSFAQKKIHIVDRHIENEDLSAIYSNATAFFFMSQYEGFGLPVLEAMQCGVPVVTSNNTSLPEIVGDAGIMLPANDQDMLCNAMNEIYLSQELRNKYAERGLKRSEAFSWQVCAEKYSTIFREICSKF